MSKNDPELPDYDSEYHQRELYPQETISGSHPLEQLRKQQQQVQQREQQEVLSRSTCSTYPIGATSLSHKSPSIQTDPPSRQVQPEADAGPTSPLSALSPQQREISFSKATCPRIKLEPLSKVKVELSSSSSKAASASPASRNTSQKKVPTKDVAHG